MAAVQREAKKYPFETWVRKRPADGVWISAHRKAWENLALGVWDLAQAAEQAEGYAGAPLPFAAAIVSFMDTVTELMDRGDNGVPLDQEEVDGE